MKELIRRLADLEPRASDTGGMSSDFRVIEMQIARAEEKILRVSKAASWTRSNLALQMTEDG